MKFFNIILVTLFTIIFAFNNTYESLMQSSYKPLGISSDINFQLSLSNSNFLYTIQWWPSNNLHISGTISPRVNNQFNLYNNISIGYYYDKFKFLYSSSNIIELDLHKIKYSNNLPTRWIQCAYKSRYEYRNFLLGYDFNHYFGKDIKDNFLSLIMAYNIKKKIIFEFQTHFIKSGISNSFNFSIPL